MLIAKGRCGGEGVVVITEIGLFGDDSIRFLCDTLIASCDAITIAHTAWSHWHKSASLDTDCIKWNSSAHRDRNAFLSVLRPGSGRAAGKCQRVNPIDHHQTNADSSAQQLVAGKVTLLNGAQGHHAGSTVDSVSVAGSPPSGAPPRGGPPPPPRTTTASSG